MRTGLICLTLAATLAGVIGSPRIATAARLNISGYDVYDTGLPCCGWDWDYTGSITAIGLPGTQYAYTGGTGTLADGEFGTSTTTTMLFTPEASEQLVTLYLDGYYTIDTIDIYGGDIYGNVHPGHLDGVDVTIDGNTAGFSTAEFGPTHLRDYSINDRVTLAGSALDGLVTNEVQLSNWSLGADTSITFSITEIVIYGTVVPEPSTALLLLMGLAGLAAAQRRSSRH